jgi:uncharacterized protein with ATP-grasp and redox domains
MYEVPPLSVDPRQLPPPLMTSEPGSFAYNTFKVRIPRIIDEIVASNHFTPEITLSMQSLRTEIVGGIIQPLREEAPDVAFWNETLKPWGGHTWLQVPWYWAETYFYRRVLEATCYFQSGEWSQVDPYSQPKAAELLPNAAPRALGTLIQRVPADTQARFEMHLHASLWGNRTDLSYNVASTLGISAQHTEERSNLLVDDTLAVWTRLSTGHSKKVAIITDNAGTELCMDLALVDNLLATHLAEQVTLHLKPQPFFVSDAMPKDVLSTIQTLATLGSPLRELGQRLQGYLDDQRLHLTSHWFYATCLFYTQLPAELRNELQQFDLVVLKGDANYRRLLGDAHWPPTASFAQAMTYFPAPLVSLRTCKAELIVGLEPGEAEQLDAQDAHWRVNGKRGVIQARLER